MKRNKSILQVLLGVLLCAALVFPGMKATVFAVDRIDETDAQSRRMRALKRMIRFRDPKSFYTKMQLSLLRTGMPLRKDQRAQRQKDPIKNPMKKTFSRKEKSPKRMEMEEVENSAPADNDLPEEAENSASADNESPEEAGNGAFADNDFLQEEGNGDPSEDAYVPAEDGTSSEMTAQPDESAQDELQEIPAEDGASSEMTAQPEEPAQDELQEIPAEEQSVEADAEELADAASYDSAAGLYPLARELTYNGKAQELIDVEDIPEGALCYSLDGEAFSPEIPTGTDAGDYIVYYRAAGEEAAQVSSLTVTISKADVIFTAPSAVE